VAGCDPILVRKNITMATIRTNPLIEGLSGMLGQSIVFKNLRGKTIITNRPSSPKKQSELQKANRSKFRQATYYAKAAMLDAEKKAYYQRKARKLKLPNAYTAAITDYMRPIKLKEVTRTNTNVTYRIAKRDFDVNRVEILPALSESMVVNTLIRLNYNEWELRLSIETLQPGIQVIVTDNTPRKWRWDLKE
jgi:hypothetical protein